MKICTKCGKNKSDSEYSVQTGIRKDGQKDREPRLCSWCRECSSKQASESGKRKRKENPELQRKIGRERYHKNKSKRAPILKEKVKLYKKKCIDYLGGSCEICGYDKCAAAMDFHHEEPETKEFEISRQTPVFNDRIKKELDKCNLLCSNCHKEIHYNQ